MIDLVIYTGWEEPVKHTASFTPTSRDHGIHLIGQYLADSLDMKVTAFETLVDGRHNMTEFRLPGDTVLCVEWNLP